MRLKNQFMPIPIVIRVQGPHALVPIMDHELDHNLYYKLNKSNGIFPDYEQNHINLGYQISIILDTSYLFLFLPPFWPNRTLCAYRLGALNKLKFGSASFSGSGWKSVWIYNMQKHLMHRINLMKTHRLWKN